MSEDATALSDPRRILCAHADWNGAGAHWKQDGEPCRVQRACDRCTQGVMDVDNPHLSGACECPCHRPIGPESDVPKGVVMPGDHENCGEIEFGEAFTPDWWVPFPEPDGPGHAHLEWSIHDDGPVLAAHLTEDHGVSASDLKNENVSVHIAHHNGTPTH